MEPLSILSGALHALGYVTYIGFVRRGLIEANPLSWLMFAYGTGLLMLLEYQSGAKWPELLLPIICSASSIVVAALAIRPTTVRHIELPDLIAFCIDLMLTAAYLALWFIGPDALPDHLTQLALLGLLVCANLTTVTAFAPIIRSTQNDPHGERAAPWILWTAAYALLFFVTYRDASPERLPLLIYPTINVALHLTVAFLAMSRWWRPFSHAHFDVRETGCTGLGLFTTQRFGRGERVFTVSGPIRRFRSRTAEDAQRNENWFGIGNDLWIDPDPPYTFVNHSCAPNLGTRGRRDFFALRDIKAGEELTLDYSITQDERAWAMECRCGSETCRIMIGSIHTLPHHIFMAYLPYIGSYFQRRYRRSQATPRNKRDRRDNARDLRQSSV